MSIERRIITGLIVSNDYLQRVSPFWDDALVPSPEMARIARWCLDYFEKYQRAPDREIEGLYMAAIREEGIPKAEAELIEGILREVSDDYERGDQFNSAYLYDQTVAFFRERGIDDGINDARGLLEQGKVVQAIIAMAETAADAIETAPAGDLSAARVAGWRIAMASGRTEERLSDPWGDPEPPPFDLTMLQPRLLREFVMARSEMMGVGTNAMAWSTLAACGAALDASMRLQLDDFDFTVPPGIWLLLVGPPSSRKSPALRATFAPLRKIQADRISAWNRERAVWLAEDSKTRGPEPTFVQLLTNNQTQEGIRDALVGQDRGITILADEWASHIGSMGRYTGGRDAGSADRAFFNEAFDGGPYTANRANRKGGDRIAVANLQVTVIGGVQPDVLRQFNQHGGLLGDGMLQRSCPILMSRPKLGRDDVRAAGVIKEYELLIRQLVRAPGNRVVRLSPEANSIRRRLAPYFMALEQNDALGQGFATAAGKLQGMWGRLALTLQHVSSARRDELPNVVGERAAALAERLVVHSLVPNLAAFYRTLGAGGDDVETMRAIAGFLLRQQRARVTGRDITRHVGMLHRTRVEQVRDAVSPLISMGWLTPEEDDERRAHAWIVNPVIYAQFAEQGAKARADAAMARSLIARAHNGEPGDQETLDQETLDRGNVYDVYCAHETKCSEPPFLDKKDHPHDRLRPARAIDIVDKVRTPLGAKVRHNATHRPSWLREDTSTIPPATEPLPPTTAVRFS